MTGNINDNNALTALIQRAAPPVLKAIKAASARTGVDFAYLMEQAAAESNFKADAKAKTSSAAGLYQFIESTWLHMVQKHGHKYGLGAYADQINEKGRVADPAKRAEIMELRKDPETASLMAAEFARENRNYLERHVGGEIGATEMYFAHFMGAGGATGFLKAMKENPLSVAADLFPQAARANHNVFYDRKTGQARTLAGVYAFFDNKFGAAKGAAPSLPQAPRIDTAAIPQKPVPKPDFTKLDFAARQDLQSVRLLASDSAAPAGNNGIYKHITHPYLQHMKQDSNYSWQRQPGLPAPSHVKDPVALMMLARLGLPGER